jgi:hypothetical protein
MRESFGGGLPDTAAYKEWLAVISSIGLAVLSLGGWRSSRAVVRALALRHDAFKSELAGMLEDERAVLLDVLVGLNARRRARDQLRECSLTLLDGIAPQVLP